MTPLERAARALSDGPHPSEWCWEKARAVIEAIRDPSEAMVDSGTPHMPFGASDASGSAGELTLLWGNMIDALLEEQP